jgi:hypothetical protein
VLRVVFRRAAFAIVLAGALAGCGGGGGGSSAAPRGSVSAAAVTARMTITVPPKTSSAAHARSPQFISPATQSAEIDVVYGTTSTVGATIDIVAGNAACVATANGTQCTLSVLVQPTATNFIVKLFDQLGEQGHLLGTATVAVPPSPNGTPIDVPVTLSGVVLQIGLSVAGGAFTNGVAGTRTLIVDALDADRNTIPGTLTNPIVLANQNPAMTLSAASIAASGTALTITYSGAGSPTIQINATDLDGGSKSFSLAPGTVGSVGPLTVSPSTMTFTFVPETLTATVTDPNSSGAYTVTGCAGMATGSVSGGVLSVTATSTGTCTLIVSDTASNAATVSVGVSSIQIPIQ